MMSDEKKPELNRVLDQINEGKALLDKDIPDNPSPTPLTVELDIKPSFDNDLKDNALNNEDVNDDEVKYPIVELIDKIKAHKVKSGIILIIWAIVCFVVLSENTDNPTSTLDTKINEDASGFSGQPGLINEPENIKEKPFPADDELITDTDNIDSFHTMDSKPQSKDLIDELDHLAIDVNNEDIIDESVADITQTNTEVVADLDSFTLPVNPRTHSNSSDTITLDSDPTQLPAIESEVHGQMSEILNQLKTLSLQQRQVRDEIATLREEKESQKNTERFNFVKAPVITILSTAPAATNCDQCVDHARVEFENVRRHVGDGDLLFGLKVDISGDRLNLIDENLDVAFSYWVKK